MIYSCSVGANRQAGCEHTRSDFALGNARTDVADAEQALGEMERQHSELMGQRTALQEIRGTVPAENAEQLDRRIAQLDREIAVQTIAVQANRSLLVAQRLVQDQRRSSVDAKQTEIRNMEAMLAALTAERNDIARETARIARRILAAYISTLEELAGANTPADASAGNAGRRGNGADVPLANNEQ